MAKHIDKQELATIIRNLQGVSAEQKSALLDLLNEKKQYGLVWENHVEDVEELLREQLPVLTEVPERRILSNSNTAPNHIIIEGDNLHALTSLCYTHEGKIDVIYIDPPYNTGKDKDFKYNDKIVDSEDDYRHSKWLSFMSKRLRIARKLLSSTGVIFISIDDYSCAQLRLLCDEIFETTSNPDNWNYTATLIWNKQHSQQQGTFKRYHEYIYVIARDKSNIKNVLTEGEGVIEAGAMKKISPRNPASDFTFPAGISFEAPDGTRLTGTYGESEKVTVVDGVLEAYDGKTLYPVTLRAGWTQKKQMQSWVDGKETFDSKGQKVIEFYFNSTGKIKCRKQRQAQTPCTILPLFGMGSEQTSHLESILGVSGMFSNPKPVEMIKTFIEWFCPKNGTVLDFFAGSGTTMESLMALNESDGGARTCILVQCNENNICEDVTYERNKRVINGYTTPKGEEIEGLSNNNLRYFRTEYVPREKSNINKRRLVYAATDLLCIKEDIYDENVLSINGKNVKKQFARRFSNDSHEMLVVYEPRLIPYIVEELKAREVTEPVKVYVFSEGQYAFNDDFKEVLDKVNLCALPEAIYQAYKKVLPKTKSPEEIAFEASEEEVEEALSVADAYSYKSE